MTGSRAIQFLAEDLLTAVLQHPRQIARQAGVIERAAWPESSEEGEVLAAVAASLRENLARGDRRQPEAELHLLRHLAGRRQ